MVSGSTESIKNEVESVVNEAVNKIYKQGKKVLDAFNWAVDQIKDQHGEGYHALAILDVMYPKLAPREQKLLAMRIPCGDTMDW
jgi:ribosomal protein S7